MSLFDRFRASAKAKPKASPAAKWADRMEKRAQNYDRQEAIQALSEMATADAAAVLLKRFTFHIDPSITDQEEKDSAFRGVVRVGEAAIEPVRAFAGKAESLAWPMKIMRELVDEETYLTELLAWLRKWDTDYAKFVDPKVQILAALEEYKRPFIRVEVERFLDDVNEPARFHAVVTLLAQDDAESTRSLVALLLGEESVRIRNRIVEGLSARGWVVPPDQRDAVRGVLTLDSTGRAVKR